MSLELWYAQILLVTFTELTVIWKYCEIYKGYALQPAKC